MSEKLDPVPYLWVRSLRARDAEDYMGARVFKEAADEIVRLRGIVTAIQALLKRNGVELRASEHGGLDEAILTIGGRVVLHIECMNETEFWLGLYPDETTQVNLCIQSKSGRAAVEMRAPDYEPVGEAGANHWWMIECERDGEWWLWKPRRDAGYPVFKRKREAQEAVAFHRRYFGYFEPYGVGIAPGVRVRVQKVGRMGGKI